MNINLAKKKREALSKTVKALQYQPSDIEESNESSVLKRRTLLKIHGIPGQKGLLFVFFFNI